jgi:hypothetical protein
VTVMTSLLVNVMVTVVVVVDRGVEAAGMTGMMMEGVEVADMTGMMMEGGAGMVAPHQGAQGAQSGKAVRSAGPRLSSGTVNGRQGSDVSLQAS